jgi:carbonic anhydrase
VPAAPKVASVVVVTCMDARIRVDRFGLAAAQVNVLRNAGGRASDDVIRSLLVAWRILDVQEFLVVHHTDCRMMATTDERIRQDVTAASGVDASRLEFLTFTDLRASVAEDVDRIRRSPYLADAVPTSGYVWDLRAQKLQPVVVDRRARAAGAAAATAARPSGAAVPSGGIWARRPGGR